MFTKLVRGKQSQIMFMVINDFLAHESDAVNQDIEECLMTYGIIHI